MFIFILGFLFLTVIQPTFYPPGSSSPPAGPTATPAPGGPTATPTIPGEPTATPTPPTVGTSPAFFTITPINVSIKKGETFTLAFILDTGDFEIDGMDLVLNFESEFFEAKSINPKIDSLNYTVREIDNNTGIIKVSAAGQIQDNTVVGFKGVSEYAEIEFLALKTTSATTISFVGGVSGSHAANAQGDHLDLAKCLPGNYQITN